MYSAIQSHLLTQRISLLLLFRGILDLKCKANSGETEAKQIGHSQSNSVNALSQRQTSSNQRQGRNRQAYLEEIYGLKPRSHCLQSSVCVQNSAYRLFSISRLQNATNRLIPSIYRILRVVRRKQSPSTRGTKFNMLNLGNKSTVQPSTSYMSPRCRQCGQPHFYNFTSRPHLTVNLQLPTSRT